MVDSFSVKMVHPLTDTSQVWDAVRILTKAIEDAHPDAGRKVGRSQWTLLAGEKRWGKLSLDALREAAYEESLDAFRIGWDYAFDASQWAVEAHVNVEYPSTVEAEVYAGKDRMATERLARSVAQSAQRHGLTMSVGQVRISSRDDDPEPAEMEGPRLTDDEVVAALRRSEPSRWARLWASAQRNLSTVVWGVVGTVTGTVVLLWLGLSGGS